MVLQLGKMSLKYTYLQNKDKFDMKQQQRNPRSERLKYHIKIDPKMYIRKVTRLEYTDS